MSMSMGHFLTLTNKKKKRSVLGNASSEPAVLARDDIPQIGCFTTTDLSPLSPRTISLNDSFSIQPYAIHICFNNYLFGSRLRLFKMFE